MRHEQDLMVFETPLGWAGVAVSEQGICGIVLPKKEKKAVERVLRSSERITSVSTAVLGRAVKLLKQYFSGKRVSFDLPLDMRYHTDFRRAVWKATAEIPFGETRPYAWIAKKIKKPGAARAVGQALGANPIPIIIP